MPRYLGVLLILTALTACNRDKKGDRVMAHLGCKAAEVVEKLEPGAGVALIPPADNTRNLVAQWRTSVGPAVVDRAGRACAEAPIDSLLVVSWNVNVGNAQIRRFVTDLTAGRIIPGVRVRNFVLLLQEAYRESPEVPANVNAHVCPGRIAGGSSDIEDVSDSLGLALYYIPSMRNGCSGAAREDRGNAILSTLPLTNLKAVELPLVRQRRVAAMADVKGKNSAGQEWTLTLASVHFENRGPGRPNDWVHGRARQSEALVAALPETDFLVVGGDFNTLRGSGEPAVRIVAGRFANPPLHPQVTTYVKYSVMRSHLDYLFFNHAGAKRGKYWRADSRYGSDHYPIMGFVRVG